MTSRSLAIASLLISATAGPSLPAAGGDDDSPAAFKTRHVVLIVVDTLRATELGTYGYNHPTSPHIDRLAEVSILFERAFATAPWTTPSVGSAITGLYPRELGIAEREIPLSRELVTLPEVFRDAGYVTHGIVSHLLVGGKLGFAQGFDSFDEAESGRGRDYVSSPGVTRRAIRFIREHVDEPFFLFLHYFDPHFNYRMHQILNTYPDYDGRLLGKNGATGNDAEISRLRELSRTGELSAADLRYLQALYDSEIRFTDAHVGEVLEMMKGAGLFHDALIVLMADHGEELGEESDGLVGHSARVSNALVHVPLIIKLPGQESGRRITTPVSLIDLMPTILELAGLEPPGGISGRPIDLRGGRIRGRDVFAETRRSRSADMIVSGDGNWKLVRDRTEQKYHLYDLSADPSAHRDVGETNPGIAEELNGRLVRWSRGQKSRAREQPEDLDVFAPSPEERRQLRELGYTDVDP